MKINKFDMKINKFYAGAKHIGYAIGKGSNATCTRSTLEEAISDAKKQIQEGAECVVVVEIVAIVRKATPPVIVDILSPAYSTYRHEDEI